jgi:hypothetical protein
VFQGEFLMSVRIYTGFKFAQRELADIVASMDQLKAPIEAMQRQRYLKAYAGIFVDMMDRSQMAIAGGRTEGLVTGLPGSLVRRAIRERQKKVRATGERDPAVDLEVILTCWYSRLLGEVVGCAYGEFTEPVLELLKDVGIATDYGYWDNVCRDENVPEEEWKQRKRVWSEVLDRKSGMGFQFRFEGEQASFPFTWDEVAPNLPDVVFRARELAEAVLFERWRATAPGQSEGPDGIWSLYMQFRTRLREDPAMKQQLAEEGERIRPQLKTSEELDKSRSISQLVISPCED